jgi:hypothetical protein
MRRIGTIRQDGHERRDCPRMSAENAFPGRERLSLCLVDRCMEVMTGTRSLGVAIRPCV